MPYVRKRIKVSDISEYPTALGNRCKLLNVNGCNPYTNTEEQVLYVLQKLACDPEALDICKSSSHCSGFWHFYKQGQTPFLENDPIRLAHYNGKYWVAEGKHRCCMAKRTGVEYIDADVFESNGCHALLPSIGKAGEFQFKFSYRVPTKNVSTSFLDTVSNKFGYAPVLWVKMPNHNGMTEIDGRVTILDDYFDTKGKSKMIMDGVFYTMSVERKKAKIPFGKDTIIINTSVVIEKGHPKTKIWLLQCSSQSSLNEMKTLFRFGCFREYDSERCISRKGSLPLFPHKVP